VRAARRLPGVVLQRRTVIWGHSQGGGAALWAGILAPSYAPELRVAGVAALAPAADLPHLFAGSVVYPAGKLFGSYLVTGYSATYPDVRFDDYVRPAARALAREVATRCVESPDAVDALAASLPPEPFFSRSPATGPLGRRLAENVPDRPIRAALLIAQGAADPLVPQPVQDGFVDRLCARGQRLDYWTYPGLDHYQLVLDPRSRLRRDLLAWTRARLADQPVRPGCARRSARAHR
jgi:alpha-beta hydrolase superfamily lysophospholipase